MGIEFSIHFPDWNFSPDLLLNGDGLFSGLLTPLGLPDRIAIRVQWLFSWLIVDIFLYRFGFDGSGSIYHTVWNQHSGIVFRTGSVGFHAQIPETAKCRCVHIRVWHIYIPRGFCWIIRDICHPVINRDRSSWRFHCEVCRIGGYGSVYRKYKLIPLLFHRFQTSIGVIRIGVIIVQ